jgi:very-short-patch-repair endonuclease
VDERGREHEIVLLFTRYARELRASQTNAEIHLWHLLRNRRIKQAKFRRQCHVSPSPYIVDFMCWEHALIIEIDGGYHHYTIEEDAARQAVLEDMGFRVLRFSNDQVLHSLESVVLAIMDALEAQ